MTKLRWTKERKKMLKLFLEGETIYSVAQKTGINPKRVQELSNHPEFQEALADAQEKKQKGKIFFWNEVRSEAVTLLAAGYKNNETAEKVGVTATTISKWKRHPEFKEELDRLSVMVGLASRAERLRLANRAMRQFISEKGEIDTGKNTFLDFLNFAQKETSGVKIDLVGLWEQFNNQDSGDATT